MHGLSSVQYNYYEGIGDVFQNYLHYFKENNFWEEAKVNVK